MNEEIKALAEKQETVMVKIEELVGKQSEEMKSFGKTLTTTQEELNDFTKKHEELQKSFDERMVELEKKNGRIQMQKEAEKKDLGSIFAQSEIVKSYRGGTSQTFNFEKKDITNVTAANAVRPDRRDMIFSDPSQLRYLHTLFPMVSTNSDSVQVIREASFTNNAAPQAGQLVAKAKSDLTTEMVTYNVQTIAHYMQAAKQVLNDAARLRDLINRKLLDGLNLQLDSQVFYGDGTGQNFTGVFVDSDIQDVGEITAGTTAADLPQAMMEHIRAAMTKLRLANYIGTATVVNPEDFETMELAKGSDNHYLWAVVNMGAERRMWRIPVIESNTIVKNDFAVGDWSMAGEIYDRESTSIQIADQHSDLFVKNGIVLLAEERKGFGIPLPNAICKGKFTVAS